MNQIDFKLFIDNMLEELRSIAVTTPEIITRCKSGDDFELCVVNVANIVIEKNNLGACVHHTPGSHVFPDVIIEFDTGDKYGIEVKSSSASKSKGWKINGNSVMGSTRDESVIDTYILFGKTAKSNIAFNARRYEECVANVVVTHSPRYLIDMDLPDGETFFDKSKIAYKTLVNSDNPIGLITSYFHAQGQKAWWLTDSTPAAVRMLCDIPEEERYECFGYGLAHYPELFSRSSVKYKRLAFWLVTEKSIVSPSLRDDFSAGGQVSLTINEHTYHKLPQIFKRLIDYKSYLVRELNNSDSESLCVDWGIPARRFENLDDKIRVWVEVVCASVGTTQLPPDVTASTLLRDVFSHSFK